MGLTDKMIPVIMEGIDSLEERLNDIEPTIVELKKILEKIASSHDNIKLSVAEIRGELNANRKTDVNVTMQADTNITGTDGNVNATQNYNKDGN